MRVSYVTKIGVASWFVALGSFGLATHAYQTATPIRLQVAPAGVEAPLPRVSVSGTIFVRAGKPFVWKGVSAFQLIELMAHGKSDQAEAFVRALAPRVNVFRIFTTAKYLFTLSPAEGRKALPATLALLHRHQVYAEVVGLADTCAVNPGDRPCPQSEPYFDTAEHLAAIGAICASEPACLGVEIANEPRNRTQAPAIADPRYLQRLAALVPAPTLVSLGSPEGSDDTNLEYAGGHYLVVHVDRADGENGWRWVRHSAELRAIQDKTGKPVVNDEPNRENAVDRNFGVGLICRLFGIGDTIHLGSLRYAQQPATDERGAFEARVRAWSLIPDDFRGTMSEVGSDGEAVGQVDSNLVLARYTSLEKDAGYVVMIGVKPGGEQSIVWKQGWQHERLAAEGGAIVFRVQRLSP